MYTFIVYGDSIYIDQLITGVCHIVGAMVGGWVCEALLRWENQWVSSWLSWCVYFLFSETQYLRNSIWVSVNTYRYIFSGMNIHLPAILGFTRYQGFDPSPFLHEQSWNDVSKLNWLSKKVCAKGAGFKNSHRKPWNTLPCVSGTKCHWYSIL